MAPILGVILCGDKCNEFGEYEKNHAMAINYFYHSTGPEFTDIESVILRRGREIQIIVKLVNDF